MDCPYCSEEMDRGYIQSAQSIFWSKKKKKIFFSPRQSAGDISIAGGFGGSTQQAFVCPKCDKVIIDMAYESIE